MPAFEELNPSTVSQVRSYIDWPAVLAGAVVALGLATVFTTFGAAIGLSTLDIDPDRSSFDFALIVTAVWLAISMVASYMAGGYIAGRMRARVDAARTDEVAVRDGINGLVVWGLVVIAGAMVMANTVSSTASAIGTAADAAVSAAAPAIGSAAGQMAGGSGANPVDTFVATMLRPSTVNPAASNPAAVRNAAAGILAQLMNTGEISDADRQYLVGAAQAMGGLPQDQTSARVDQTIQAMLDARASATQRSQEAEDLAKRTAEAARVSGVLTGFLLAAAGLVAAAAAYVGAVHGGRHRDEGRIFGGFSYRYRG